MANKKGARRLVIFGIPVGLIFYYLIMFGVVGPALDDAFTEALKHLGTNNVCPSEFETTEYKVCFNADGEVIVDGSFKEPLEIKVDAASRSCHIATGEYDFEYSGCKLDKFKQLTAYNLIMISNKGKISISGSNIINKIMSGTNIFKITPNGIRFLKKLSYAARFM